MSGMGRGNRAPAWEEMEGKGEKKVDREEPGREEGERGDGSEFRRVFRSNRQTD